MDNFQIIVLSNYTDNILYIHVIASFTEDNTAYSRLLDLCLPGYRVIRNAGFTDEEVSLIIPVLQEYSTEIEKNAGKGAPLLLPPLFKSIEESFLKRRINA